MKSILADIHAQDFKPVYVLYGEETYLLHQYRDRLTAALSAPGDAMNVTRFQGKDSDIREIIQTAQTMPFFAPSRLVLIEESGLFSKACAELANFLEEVPPTAHLVFVEASADKRLKQYKKAEKIGRVVAFQRQTGDVLSKWILQRVRAEGKQMSRSLSAEFVERIGDDMVRLDTELEKLLTYCLDREEITAADVDAVCTPYIEGRIFAMIDTIADRDSHRALELYHGLLYTKEPPMRILSLITRQFHTLWHVKEMTAEHREKAEIASQLHLPYGAVTKCQKQASRFHIKELENAVRACIDAEYDFKTGKRTDRLAVEMLIVMLSGERASFR